MRSMTAPGPSAVELPARQDLYRAKDAVGTLCMLNLSENLAADEMGCVNDLLGEVNDAVARHVVFAEDSTVSPANQKDENVAPKGDICSELHHTLQHRRQEVLAASAALETQKAALLQSASEAKQKLEQSRVSYSDMLSSRDASPVRAPAMDVLAAQVKELVPRLQQDVKNLQRWEGVQEFRSKRDPSFQPDRQSE